VSRRDYKKVARHEMPGTRYVNARPGGYGVIGNQGTLASIKHRDSAWLLRGETFKPYPTGRIFLPPFPRHCVPAYLHVVPRGQDAFGALQTPEMCERCRFVTDRRIPHRDP
jgi:hypothetical protein